MDLREFLEKYKPLRLEDLRDTGPAEAISWLERRLNEAPRQIALRVPEYPTQAHVRLVNEALIARAREMDCEAERQLLAAEAWESEGGR